MLWMTETTEAKSYSIVIDDVEYILIDTPDFNDTTHSDEQILQHITIYLSGQFARNELLSGIIYLHPINRDRFQGTDVLQANVFKQLCGSEALQSVVFATTFWEHIDGAVGQARETELIEDLIFEDLIRHCTRTARIIHNNRASALELIKCFRRNGQITLKAQKESLTDKESSASELLNREKRRLEADKQKEIESRKRKAAEELATQKLQQQAEAACRRKEQEDSDRLRRQERENREREASLERWRAQRRQEEVERLKREAIEKQERLAAEEAEHRRQKLEQARLMREAEQEKRRQELVEAELAAQRRREAAERSRINVSRESFRAKSECLVSTYPSIQHHILTVCSSSVIAAVPQLRTRRDYVK